MKFKHVLLIDDTEVDNYICQHILEDLEIADHITVMYSAQDALKFLEETEHFPEIIFLDIRMPRMDGFEFLEEFDKFPEIRKKHTNIYMLTSSNHPEDLKKASENKYVKKYFIKPFDPEMAGELSNI